MSLTFEEKVHSIVLSNIAEETFGVSELARLLNLSNSQTQRKVKTATGKSVNQFITEVRLAESTKLIENSDLSMSEISFQVGFSSASYFSKVFSKHFGMAPGEYKSRQQDGELLMADGNLENKESLPWYISKRMVLFAGAIVLVLVAGYFMLTNGAPSKSVLPNSIAVLPFKDYSPEDSQWFSDGMSDNILHSLAQLEDLSVISFTSSSTFRDSDKKIPEIADELGVSYVLEGSVTLYDNKFKILAQLIDANDIHVWSKEYKGNLDDVIAVQNNVAQEVIKQMQITLSPKEARPLNKYRTANMEAYSLFQKGRLVNDSRTLEDIQLNIAYNKQALALDSSFADAYGEISFSYFLLSHYYSTVIDPFESRALAESNARKALEIDPNTIRAISTLAVLNWYVDWEKSLELFKKALALSPNDATTNLQYSVFLESKPNPDLKAHLDQCALVYKLNPLSVPGSVNYISALLNNGFYDEAGQVFQKIRFLYSAEEQIYYDLIVESFKNHSSLNYKKFYVKRIKEDPSDAYSYNELANYYRYIAYDNSKAPSLVEKAYALDSTYISNYVDGLIANDQFEDAEEIMSTANYVSVLDRAERLKLSWRYYYQKEDYEKALKALDDSVFLNQYWEQTLTYARMGNAHKIDSLNKRYPWGTGRISDWRVRKAILNAVLNNRDSMYYYLEGIEEIRMAAFTNYFGKEFDPYREEDRFKAFQKKWLLSMNE